MRPSHTLPPSLGLLLVMGALGFTQACVSRNASSGDIEVDCSTDEEPSDGAAEAGEDEDATSSDDAGEEDASLDGAALDASQDAETSDAGLDADASEPDATEDAGDLDAAPDGGLDATPDASPDGHLGDAGSGGDADVGPDTAPVCTACPDGRCLPDGTCVECSADLPCIDSALKCDLGSHTCVECRPNANDCMVGTYCNENSVCVQGCNDNASCSSGRCNAQHVCEGCLDDSECGPGQLCGTFDCFDPCMGPGDPVCTGGTQCCDHQCVDLARDIQNCAGCGISCQSEEFCGRAGCTEVTLGKLCENQKAVLVLSGLSGDAAETEVLRAALESTCHPAPVLSTVLQSESDLLNPVTGQPLAGGNTILLTLGSKYANKLVAYIENNRIAPVYLLPIPDEQNAMFEFRRSSTDDVLLSAPVSGETPMHAYFLVQMVRDPATGSLITSGYGYWAEGTIAARWFLTNQVLPNLSAYTENWYIFEWESTNGDEKVDPDDYFSLIASGR